MNLVISFKAGQVVAMLARLEYALSGPGLAQGIHHSMTTPVRTSTERRFAGEGDEAVGEWAELTQRTQQLRQAQGFGYGPINVRTGEMKAWATTGDLGTRGVGPSWVKMVYPDSSPTGELERKIKVAQAGEGKTPARPILSWTDSDLEALLVGMTAWFEGVLR